MRDNVITVRFAVSAVGFRRRVLGKVVVYSLIGGVRCRAVIEPPRP